MTAESTKPRPLKVNIKPAFNKSAALRQVQITHGDADPEVHIRCIKGRDVRMFDGAFSDNVDDAAAADAAGYAIYFLPNETDGNGHTKGHVRKANCLTLDLDSAPLPETWEVQPSLILNTSPERYQVFWAIHPTTDLEAVENVTARLAAHYGGDRSAKDVTHIFRLAGSVHRKAKPFQTRIVHAVRPEDTDLDTGFSRFTLQDFDYLPQLPTRENAASSASTEIRIDEAKAKLLFANLRPEKIRGDEAFTKFAMSLHHACQGDPVVGELFQAWCLGDERYQNDRDETNNEVRYGSFREDKDGALTVGTLIQMCVEFGVSQEVMRDVFFDAKRDFEDEPIDKKFDDTSWPHTLPYNSEANANQLALTFGQKRPEAIIFVDGIFYSCGYDGIWYEVSEDELKAEIRGTDPTATIITSVKMNTMIDELKRRHVTKRPFEWLTPPPDAPEPKNTMLFRNGILDVTSGKLFPHSGDYFATSTPDFDYSPRATCPTWDRCLGEWLDPSYHKALHEMLGYLMVPDNSLEKIFFLRGVRRGGKSTVVRIVSKLIGGGHCESRTLSDLAESFGLKGIERLKLITIPDAHSVKVQNRGSLLDRLKSISGNDAISINRKHQDIITAHVPTRILIASNTQPKLLDESGALGSRIIPFIFERTFEGKEDPDLSKKLLAELPGIANRAIEGLKRLRRNGGRFTLGQAARDSLDEIADSQSPALRFAKEHLEVTGNKKTDFVQLNEVYDRYELFATSERLGRETRNKNDLKDNLVAALASQGVSYARKRLPGSDERYQAIWGVRLKPLQKTADPNE